MHFVNIGQNAAIPNYVMRQITNIMDRHIIPQIGGDYFAVSDSSWDLKIVMLQNSASQATYADKPEKLGVPYLARIKLISDEYLIPVICIVAVFHQELNLM